MSQLSLFDSQRPAPERRPPNLPFIRKHLNRVLRLMRDAEIMPWGEPETKSWEQQFPKLARMLPSEEGEAMLSAFEVELERLKAA
jgi:hypothetical protein